MILAKFLLYEGVSEDPMQQTVRLVEGDSIDEVWEREKEHALSVQEFVEEPARQEPLDEKKLRHGMPVWAT